MQNKQEQESQVPVSEHSDWLFPEQKGFRVLDRYVVMFPLSVNTVVLKHVRLHKTKPKQHLKKQIHKQFSIQSL